MDNKRPSFKSSTNFERPKLIKRDIKISQNKKENNIPSNNINKSIKKNSSHNLNNLIITT